MSAAQIRTSDDYQRECLEFAKRLEALAEEVREGRWTDLDAKESIDAPRTLGHAEHTLTIKLSGKRSLRTAVQFF